MQGKRKLLLSFLFGLISCKDLVYQADRNDDNLRTIPITEASDEVFANPQYLDLLDIADQINSYCQEEAEQLHVNIVNQVPEKNKDSWIDILKERQEANIKLIRCIYQETICLLNNTLTINDYLAYLLKLRFYYLENRKTGVKDTVLSTAKKLALPTNKRFSDFLLHNTKLGKQKDTIEIVRLCEVHRFEFFNLLIREAFKKCSLDELQRETIDFLRASVQLHPILAGDRKDLGHPDEAGNYYALFEPILFPSKNTADKLINLMELKKMTKNYLPTTQFVQDNPNFALLVYMHNILFAGDKKNKMLYLFYKENQSAIQQEILLLTKHFDTQLYESHFLSKPQKIQLKNMGTPLDDRHQIQGSWTDYEVGIWPYALPHPSFLSKKSEGLMRASYLLGGQQENEINKQPLNEAVKKEKLKKQQKEKPDQLDHIFSNKPHVAIKEDKEKLKDHGLPYEATVDEGIIKKAAVQIQPLIISRKAQAVQTASEAYLADIATQGIAIQAEEKFVQSTVEPINKAKIYVKKPVIKPIKLLVETEAIVGKDCFFEQWILPKGLRTFHAKMLYSPYLPVILRSNKNQAIVDQLFDYHQACKVTFGAFKVVWEYIGGRIYSNHGGSHRALIGPHEETLFGIFAHGKNQTYGKEYIKYLQTAFLYVGLRPNNKAIL